MVALDQFTIRDTFTDDDDTTLASHASDINFSGNPWKKQFAAGGTLEIQSNQVKLPAIVFGLPYTLYTRDAGSENYIIRLRMAGARVEPVYFWFRVAPNNTGYCIQANHDTTGSYLRFMYFDGTDLIQLAEVNPGSLTDGGFHWYQIHIVGASARAFVEGFGAEVKTTMINNLSETLIGLGGQRPTQLVDELQVIPISPGAAGTDLSSRMLQLEATVDSILTSVPSAITSLKGELGESAVDAMNANPPDVVAASLSAAAISSVEQSLTNNDFSLLDTFTDTDETALASHDPEINFSARPWLKQNGQNMVISDEGGGVFVAKPVADDFTPARTLYTMDAGSENYIIRARLSGFRVAPGMLMFRVAANDSYYGILFNHDTVASYLRIFEFNGDETTTLADVNPGSLVSESYHWYQIHVAGSRVRAFVEGFNVEAVAEMSINLSETRIGIGGQRASTKFDAIEVIPLQPGAAGEAFSTKLDVLTKSTELLATSVPSAIAGLKDEIGIATEAKVDTLTSNLSALSGITSAAADTGLAIKATTDTLAARSIPVVHVSITESNPPFNALHDVRSLSANWAAERGDLVYSNTAGTTRATEGGFVKGWRDQVNGWLASQTVPTDNLTFDIVDGMPGVVGDGTIYGGLDIESAGGVLFQDKPYSYVFIAHRYANVSTTQYAFTYSATGVTGTRRVGCALNNNGPKLWANGRRVGADAYFDAFDRSGLVHGVWSIGTYAFEWAAGTARVRSNLTDYEAVAMATTGNSEDGASGRMRIHSAIGTNAGSGTIGPIGEIVVANPTTIYTEAELDAIVTGMMAKWGVV